MKNDLDLSSIYNLAYCLNPASIQYGIAAPNYHSSFTSLDQQDILYLIFSIASLSLRPPEEQSQHARPYMGAGEGLVLAYGDIDHGRNLPDQTSQGFSVLETIPVGNADPLFRGIDSLISVLFGQSLDSSLPSPGLAAGYDMSGLITVENRLYIKN